MRTITLNAVVYVPFWIVLDYLDIAPPHPFIKCTVININKKIMQSPNGNIELQVCDLELGKPDLIATSVPLSYIIVEDELKDWATKIANWFMDYLDVKN